MSNTTNPKYESVYSGLQVDNAVSSFVNTIGVASKEDHMGDYKALLTPSNHEYLKCTIGSNDIITIKKQEGTMVSLFNLDNLTVGSNKVLIDIQDRDGERPACMTGNSARKNWTR